ncbi:MAG: TonB-dependent receptor domain-containing protein [Chitinophagales bacterium]
MKKLITLSLSLILFSFCSQVNAASIKGQLQDSNGEALVFAAVALYNDADSTLAKVETSDEAGIFQMQGIKAGNYYLQATYVGLSDFKKMGIVLTENQDLDVGILAFEPASVKLQETTVTASRVMVETKPDRTIFNVSGTINSTGSDGISLLRKAPAVMVDNNDNISVLGRSGVLLYVDGKRMPLTGADQTAYLQNLPADQIDRIEIITNPGAKYEAEGNAGIIDIRLKKDKNLGANGSVSATFTQGRYAKGNLNGSGNYRNKKLNIFGTLGIADGKGFNDMNFDSYQNNIRLIESNESRNNWTNHNYRLGTDFFLHKNHTIGFLVSGANAETSGLNTNRIAIALESSPNQIDSILVANNVLAHDRTQNSYNLNYRFDNGDGSSLNVDLDYGKYGNKGERYQPNQYFDANEEVVLTEVINSFETPTDIDIYTFKVDYEEKMLGGTVGIGSKLSQVVSENTFLVFDEENGSVIQNNDRSNFFKYDEKVYAGYVSYARKLNDKWNLSAGLRAEKTDAMGDLEAFSPDKQEDPVVLDYLSWFPSAGLTWQVAPKHSLALNYGRRINRPDYNVLNPFENQLSQISYEKGNPFLRPEIVNNMELGYTMHYRYNFKLGYSRTIDQITRLIGPDESDPRANFITWDNLATKTVVSFNASIPTQITKKWGAYFNFSASHIDNQADYGEGAIVDLQAFTYSIYQQHTFDLPAGFKGEISGYFSGPGIWGGVFEYETSWSLNFGLQKKFFNDKLNARLSFDDVFYETGWDGISVFNGLVSEGGGNWDSRKGSLSLSYNFGNQNVKSRKRKTGIEDEAGRVQSGN